MQRFELSVHLLTNHALIDEQHARLVVILNEATRHLASAQTLESFRLLTDQLVDYAGYHFKTEEDLMVQSAYAAARPHEAGAHLAEHRDFVRQVTGMRVEFERSPRQVAGQQLVRFLQDWLAHHIGESDHDLGRHLAAWQPK